MLWLLITLSFCDVYGIPNRPSHDRYQWLQVGEWSPCSVDCGQGVSRAIYKCFDTTAGGVQRSTSLTSKSKCKGENPDMEKECFKEPCSNDGEYLGFWFKSPWGDCSVTCGKGALSRAIACVNHASTGILEESQCPIEKPISYQVCTKQKCPVQYSWFVGEWKKCSNDCEGTQNRNVQCRTFDNEDADEKMCVTGEKPVKQQPCGTPCVTWVVGKWRECKYKRQRSCRDAVQARCVLCIHKTTFKLSDKCNKEVKPSRKRNCSLHACSSS